MEKNIKKCFPKEGVLRKKEFIITLHAREKPTPTAEAVESAIEEVCGGKNPFAILLGGEYLIRCGGKKKVGLINLAIRVGKATILMQRVTTEMLRDHLTSLTRIGNDGANLLPPKIPLHEEEMRAVVEHLVSGPDQYAYTDHTGSLRPIAVEDTRWPVPATKAMARAQTCHVSR